MKKSIVTRFFILCLYGLALMLGRFAPAQGFAFQQGFLEPVISRANRPGQIVAIIQNTNTSAANNITVQVQLPGGAVGLGASVGLTSSVPVWNAGQTMQFTWDVQSPVATNGNAILLVTQGATTLLNTTFPVWWQGALTVTNQNYVPAPVPVSTGRYLVGAMICPFWRDTGFSSIYNYPDRKPALGYYYDEGDFEATDWEIKWALEHGVSFFAACWYRDPANVGSSPVVPQHQRWLEGGFLNGQYGSQAKFAIMSVGNIVNSQGDLVTNVFPYWLQNYFLRTNYLVLDNKPVVYFFDSPLSNAVMAAALTQIRTQCVQAGFSGLYAIGCYNGFTSAGQNTNNQWMAAAGMDYSYAYHLPSFMISPSLSQHPVAAQITNADQICWTAQEAGVIPNLVTVSSGWDSQPWGFSTSSIQWRLNPASYTGLLKMAKANLDSRGGTGLDTKLLLLDNWDEFGEGHFFGVTRQYAWGYLDAVLQVFESNAPPILDLGPQDVGRATPYYDGQDRGCMVQSPYNALNVVAGGSNSFPVILSVAPTNTIVVTNTVGISATNVSIVNGAQMIFTPSNWNTPQNVTLTATTPAWPLQSVHVFSSAGGTSGYADNWVQINVFSNPTNAPVLGSWAVDASGNWSSSPNWLGGNIAAGLTGTAYFTNNISTSRTVTVDASPGGIAGLVFGSPSANNWTLSGGTMQLAPASSIAVNSGNATISSVLSGNSFLTKSGSGTLLLSGANTFGSGTLVQSGFLKAGTTNAFGTQSVIVSTGATVDVNGNTLISGIVASGTGADGNGAVVNTSGVGGGMQQLSLAGNTTIRDVYSGLNIHGTIAGGGFTLTILGNSGNPAYGYVGVGDGPSNLGDINIVSGALYANGYLPNLSGCLGIATNTITVSANGTLGFPVNGNATHNKIITLNGGRIYEFLGGSPTLLGAINLNANSIFDVADTLTVSGPIGGAAGFTKVSAGTLVLTGTNTFGGTTAISSGTLQIANSLALQNSTVIYTNGSLILGSLAQVTFGGFSGSKNLSLTNTSGTGVALNIGQNGSNTAYSGVLSGNGSVIKSGGGNLLLTGANSWRGSTIINAGGLQLGSAGSISNTPLITISNNALLDVSAVSGGFVLGTNQVLRGIGTVNGNLTVLGILSPGNPLGAITNYGNATLRGLAILGLGKNAGVLTNVFFTSTGTLDCGGSLVVTNLGTDALAAGDSFQLLNAASYVNSFTNVTLPSLTNGLYWTNRLNLDGTLAVVPAVSTIPTNLMYSVVGSTIQLNWPMDHLGWRLEAQTNFLGTGLGTNWTSVTGSDQTNLILFQIDSANGSVFYRLVYP